MEFKFADVGEGISEGEIVRWHVQEGDEVDENQTIVEVETDKAIVDIPSPCDGVVQSIPHGEGETIEVGEVLAEIEPEETAETASTTVVGDLSGDAEVLDESGSDEETADEGVLATPKTRKLAEELGVDLEDIEGTGKEGRVTEEDVRAAAGGHGGDGPVEKVPLKGVRKRIAETMQKGHEEIPQVTHMDELDVTKLMAVIRERRETEDLSYKLTLTPVFVKVLAECLGEHPSLNASFDGDEIIMKKYYNIGVTVDTDDGLIVPVVREADKKSVFEIGEEIDRLARRARDRSIDLEDLQGGTFTLTNIGFVGGNWSTPQVKYPEAAILATGRAEEKPVARNGEVTVRTMLPVSLSFDHRILDGAEAARFTNDLAEKLSSPESLFP